MLFLILYAKLFVLRRFHERLGPIVAHHQRDGDVIAAGRSILACPSPMFVDFKGEQLVADLMLNLGDGPRVLDGRIAGIRAHVGGEVD